MLVDAGHTVLNAFSPKSQAYAAKMLEQRGVQIRLGTHVKEVQRPRSALRWDHDPDPHGDLGGRSQGFILIRQSGNQDWSWWSH